MGEYPLVFLVSFVWITLHIIAIFLAAAARREPRFYFTKGTASKPLVLWLVSMLVLDAAIFFVGIIAGYNPPYFVCGMLSSVQWSYILVAIAAYVKLKNKGDQFDEVKERKNLRAASLGASSLNTMLLAISLNIISFDGILPFLAVFVIGLFFAVLDSLFLRVYEQVLGNRSKKI